MKYSIVIMTYNKRFKEWLKPLVIEIKRQRPDIEIIVCINGELNYFDEEYRKSMLMFLADYKNVFPVFYPRFRSFSRKVNLGCQFASEENILVLSDDLTLEDGFFNTYEHVLESHQLFSINISFSAFSLTKTLLCNLGWMDEKLLGLGWEDGDFMNRFENKTGHKFPNTVIDTCKNVADPKFYRVYNERLHNLMKTENSLEGHILDKEFSRYSDFNRKIFESNLPPMNSYPSEQFYLENRDKLHA